MPVVVDKIGCLPSSTINSLLLKSEFSEGPAWQILGELSDSLARIADAMRQAQVGHVTRHWRNEQLAVCNAQGQRLGSVERGAVRPLGIATRAVHLVGRSSDGRMWVQQRALNKSNDPGQWDTLMGGMVSAQDTLQTALARETWEEAGLHVDALRVLTAGGRVCIQRPTASQGDGGDDLGIGYMVEEIDWFHATLPDGMLPQNQDGEVEKFELLDKAELLGRLQRNEFTLEATLILVAALGALSTA